MIGYDDVIDKVGRTVTDLAPADPHLGYPTNKGTCPVCKSPGALSIVNRAGRAAAGCRNNCDGVAEAVGFAVGEEEHHSGQVRIGYRLTEQFADLLRYNKAIGWLYYDGKRWKSDDCGHAQRAVIEVIKQALVDSVGGDGTKNERLRKDAIKCESAPGIAGVLSVASALAPFATTIDQFDADPYLLNMSDGTFDLRTMELRDHDPRDLITKVTRAAYDPDAPNASWHKFLIRVLPDVEVRAYLQRVAGIALCGRVLEHVLPILTGEGRNGKGTWYGAMLDALGDYAAAADPELFVAREGKHPTGLMDLRGRRMAVVSETGKHSQMDEPLMKRLSGGDRVKARYMHKDLVEFTPSHTPFLISNHLPKVSGDDPAVWARLRVIPFDVVIPPEERNPHLDEELQLEADAVLAWAIAGWQEYREHGLREPDGVLAATGAYQDDSDAVGRFIAEECTTTSAVLQATTAQLFGEWERWRVIDGVEAISQKAFGQALDKRGYPAGKPSNGKRWRKGIAVEPANT